MQRTRKTNFLATAVSPRHRQGRMRMGFDLMRDKATPLHLKFLAFTFAVSITILLVAFEVPLEGVVAFIAPIFGVPLDFAVDGIEILVLPVLLSFLIMPSLAKRSACG